MGIDRYFSLSEHETTVWTEVLAGLTTFLTMAYAILLIPAILSETGMDLYAVFTATLIVGAYASIFMGLYANYPFVLAPGLALTAYFTYSIVLGRGYSWQAALGIVFFCGVFFVILNLLKIRQLIVEVIPSCLRIGLAAGLGLFLALIAMRKSGMIISSPKALLGFGDLTHPSMYMSMLGIILIGILLALRVRGALFIGILICWIIGLIFGLTPWEGIFSLPFSLKPTFFQLDVFAVFKEGMFDVFLSFFLVSLFDTSGMLVGLAEQGRFLHVGSSKSMRKCHFPRVNQALIPDATGSILASFLGTSTMAVYIESAAGISVGGRTGLSSIVVGLLFALTLFFGKFVASIPFFAIAPALMIVGGFMLFQVVRLDWEDPTDWVPAFGTLIFIPLTFSVAHGMGVGFVLLSVLKIVTGRAKELHWFVYFLTLIFLIKFLFFPVG